MNRSFLAERENDCLQGLLLCPVDPGTIYWAKMAGNFIFMMIAQAVIVPVFVFFFNLPLSSTLAGVVFSLALGTLGFAAVGTLFAVIAVRTRAREVLLQLVLLPLVVPLFIAGVKVTGQALAGKALAEVAPWLNLMVGYDAISLVVGWLLFEYAVEE